MELKGITYSSAANALKGFLDWRNHKKGGRFPSNLDEIIAFAIETLEILAEEQHPETEEAKKLKLINELLENINNY